MIRSSKEREVNKMKKSMIIKMAMAYMKIIDNPLQDTHLLSVLFSPVYALTPDELVRLTDRKNKYLYESAKQYVDSNEDSLSEKLKRFFAELDIFRQYSKLLMPVEELLREIFDRTGLYNYAGLLSAGEQRRKNLDRLLSLAAWFDANRQGGICAFNVYLDELAQTNVRERAAITSQTNSVTIMTMHQSKGLEFPVVFIPQLCSRFRQNSGGRMQKKNEVRNNPNIALDRKLGIGLRLIDPEKRTISNTLTNLCIENSKELDELQENLRLLYVAMTRASEKLYMVGACYGKAVTERCMSYLNYEKQLLPTGFMQTAAYYMEWLLTALARSNRQTALKLIDEPLCYNSFINDFDFNCLYSYYDKENFDTLLSDETSDKPTSQDIEDIFAKLDAYETDKNPVSDILDRVYPYARTALLPSKTSISEIKHRYIDEMEDAEQFVTEYTGEYTRPVINAGEKMNGALHGTIYHTFMENIDFKIKTREQIEEYKKELVKKGIFNEKEVAVVNTDKIYKFLNSDICRRIADSAEVDREIAFTLGLTPYEVYNDEIYKDDKELIHVDGVIDLYFEENDGVVLIDYKTDHIENGDFGCIMKKYEIQLKLYAEAIERATGKRVKERGLYLFGIDEMKFYK